MGSTSPAVVYGAIAVGLLVVTIATWPVGLVALPLVGLLTLWSKVLAPRQVAKALRAQPTADEPYTVTLDAEGLHVVGPSIADHLRWRSFEDADGP